MTHFRYGTVTVVTQTLNHNGRAARTITFIDDGFHVRVFITTHTASDGTVQSVAGHVIGQRFIYSRAQTRVGIRIAAAQFSCRYQFTNNFSEDFTALGILRSFTMSGVGPFTMTCHKYFLKKSAPFQATLMTNSSIACRLLQDLVSAAASGASSHWYVRCSVNITCRSCGNARQNQNSVLCITPGA